MSLSDFRIIKQNGNGGVIIRQVLEAARMPGESDEQALDRLADGNLIVGIDELPPRETRSAWSVSKGKLVVDKQKVKDSVMARVRSIRNAKLAELDVPSIRAIEDGDTEKSAEIKAKKQELRDLPEIVEQRLSKITDNKRKKDATKLKELQEFRVPELED